MKYLGENSFPELLTQIKNYFVKKSDSVAVSSVETVTATSLSLGNGLGVSSNVMGLKNNLSNNVNITISSSDPSGGSSGDIWFKYN